MPPRERKPEAIDPNADQSGPPAAAVTDATVTLEEKQTADTQNRSSRRSKDAAPEPASGVNIRGTVSKIGALGSRGRQAAAGLAVKGVVTNKVGTEPTTERNWVVRVSGPNAAKVLATVKQGEEIEAPAFWLAAQESETNIGEVVDNVLVADAIYRPLDFGASQELNGQAQGGAADGAGVSIA